MYIGTYNDKDPTPSRAHGRWSWNRGYGCLYLVENERAYGRPPSGASVDGYVWSKAPGATIPAVTDEEYLKYHTIDGKPELNPNGVELASRGGPGNGSLTFNETEENFGRYGNYSFQTRRQENQKIWNLFNIDGVEGKKSYHIFRDKIVCLGSGYQAGTERPMETVLFQEATETDGVYWKSKNPQRWNPGKLEVNVNGDRFGDAFAKQVPMTEGSYVIAPYGHAWVVPGGQQGELRLEWKERTTPLVGLEKDRGSPLNGYSKDRQIELRFAEGMKVRLLSTTSGLPQTNPPLNAAIKDNVLTFTTRNGVTDTFIIKMN